MFTDGYARINRRADEDQTVFPGEEEESRRFKPLGAHTHQ